MRSAPFDQENEPGGANPRAALRELLSADNGSLGAVGQRRVGTSLLAAIISATASRVEFDACACVGADLRCADTGIHTVLAALIM